LDTIYFDKSSYDLLPESRIPLDQIVSYLKKNPNIQMKIIGHTDLNGNFEDNMVLSQNRSKSVAAYLIEKGIGKNRLHTEGRGSKEPIFQEKDDEASKRNRRTEFEVIP
jgi:outer membrane protein OmpA-like peptidoglycan-associated protein